MIDGRFVQELDQRFARPMVVAVNGRQKLCVPGDDGYEMQLMSEPVQEPALLALSTLTGLVDYVELNRDEIDLAKCVLHVEGPRCVSLRGRLTGEWQQRFTYAVATCEGVLGAAGKFRFDEYGDHESVIVALQALFADAWDRSEVLGLLGGIKDGSVRQFDDNGVTQEVTARAGLTLVSNVSVPSPVVLAPYRTFRELEQPASAFVLRLKAGNPLPQVALFEADGGQWKLEAITRIRTWLAEKLGEKIAVIA